MPGEGVIKVIASGDSFLGSVIKTGVLAKSRVLFSSIHSLNDVGQIAVSVELEDGRSFTALATPVPEPSQFALVGIGVITLWARRRQQKTRRSRHSAVAELAVERFNTCRWC